MELFELIQTLNTAHGPSGDEGAVREAVAGLARPYADEVAADTLGNLIVRKRGSGPRVMLCAHMDSIGLIVTHIGKEGFLRVGTLGGIAARELLYTPVRFKNGVRGVIVPEEKAEFGKLKLDACYVDIGAKDEEQARRMVQVGDTAVYDTAIFLSGDKVISPYLDNRISCAVLLRVLEELDACPNDLYLVFSAQEEVGLRGARTAAWSIRSSVTVSSAAWAPSSALCRRCSCCSSCCPSWRTAVTWPASPSSWTACSAALACPVSPLSPCSCPRAAASPASWLPRPSRTRRTAA